jgi:hypothetical protein
LSVLPLKVLCIRMHLCNQFFSFRLSRTFGMFQFLTIYNLPQGLRLVNENTQACFGREVQINLSASSYDFVFISNLMNYFEITVFYQ